MKRITTLLCLLLFMFSVYAETEIPLTEKGKSNNGYGKDFPRTEVVVPSASIEDGVVTIETELASWGVTVTVYNGDGAVVYTSVSATEGKTHVFAVGELAEGDYVLEVELGEDLYEGNFTL